MHEGAVLEMTLLYPITDGKKECSRCHNVLPIDNFWKPKKGNYKSNCGKCAAIVKMEWLKKTRIKKGITISIRPKPIIDGKKECTYCHQMLPIEKYGTDQRLITKYIARCRKCQYHVQKTGWNFKNRERLTQKRKMEWANLSKEKREKKKIYIKHWRYTTEGGRKFNQRCLKATLERYHKIKNDPVSNAIFQERQRRYETDQRNNNPHFKIKKNLSRRIRSALTKFKMRKNISTLQLTGVKNIQFLMDYLAKQFKPGMTWDNYGKWHIDHIKACTKFDLTDPEEQRACFNYTNLQPLWAVDNIKKGAA
jgi:hypothetical protein